MINLKHPMYNLFPTLIFFSLFNHIIIRLQQFSTFSCYLPFSLFFRKNYGLNLGPLLFVANTTFLAFL